MPDILMRSEASGDLVIIQANPDGSASAGSFFWDAPPDFKVEGILEFRDITAINHPVALSNGNATTTAPIESVFIVPNDRIFYLENIFCVYRFPQLDRDQTQKKRITAHLKHGTSWMALASLWLYRKDPCDTVDLLPLFTSDQALRLAEGKEIGFSVRNEQANPASAAETDSINLVLHGYLQRPTNPNLR